MASLDLAHTSSFKGGSETFLRNVFENILKTYLRKNPTTKRIWELIQSLDNEKICYDHFTFMTLKVDSYGIDSLSSFFMNYGYKIGLWFSPPDVIVPDDGHGLGNGPLPRLVMGEILVDELSPESQAIIRKYLKPEGGKQALLSSILGSLIWEKPTWSEFKQIAEENELAAWAFINGYTLNHLAFAAHRLKHVLEHGFDLNHDGGVLKVSTDGLLLQVSSISEKLPVEFADGVTKLVPASYIEFTDRLVLPQFKELPYDQIKEFHRREDFALNNADNILESSRFTSNV
ncbi:hypothetical protein ARALYDRAFT_331242 [Arabidopsis lyrata subsp. lyrata]|uniref:2-oxoadipate dioxygenase/decarboxylase n=1 Tax=Arabidopsis lyrata subsp. lyrata TaxID=81972 RepID=D7MLM3_ARALL|nr:hypothetical protein ARALYDRAFT_331242 [Arabidopsis lyrata subsp. lyrata]